MVKVVTYGTFDHLHYGHIRLLERAKALGDYLIVGVTAEDFDKVRGKINVEQSLMERVEAVRATGIADEIIIEEYEGQKIEDIRRYQVDIFTVGSDWVGHFDYLNEYCKVVYLDRTVGVSSSEIREKNNTIKLGIVGNGRFLKKVVKECEYVNSIKLEAICSENDAILADVDYLKTYKDFDEEYAKMLESIDAVYIRTDPGQHYEQIKRAINAGVHVLCEAPMVLKVSEREELSALAKDKHVQFIDALKTAYSTAYERMQLLLKTGIIGDVVCVEATCTSLKDEKSVPGQAISSEWDNIYEWGPTALLPVLQILGTEYKSKNIIVKYTDDDGIHDGFTKMDFVYDNAVASIKTGIAVKAEGELVISGTKGYVYVPAPWWKNGYFEVRYEDSSDNKRYFYQLDGEGIRYELVAFANSIASGKNYKYVTDKVSEGIVRIMEDFINKKDVITI